MQVSTIFSKNVLEKPRLVYTYNVRYFVCSFIRRDRFAIQLRFLSRIPLWFTWEWTIFQTFKMSHSLLFPIKNSPSPPLPTQYCYVCFKECLLLSKKVRKIKPNIKYRGKEGKKQNTVTYLFFFKIYVENYQALMLLDQYKDSIQFQIDILRKWSHLRFH